MYNKRKHNWKKKSHLYYILGELPLLAILDRQNLIDQRSLLCKIVPFKNSSYMVNLLQHTIAVTVCDYSIYSTRHGQNMTHLVQRLVPLHLITSTYNFLNSLFQITTGIILSSVIQDGADPMLYKSGWHRILNDQRGNATTVLS